MESLRLYAPMVLCTLVWLLLLGGIALQLVLERDANNDDDNDDVD